MPETVIEPHTLRYKDAEGVEREMPDTLHAIANTRGGVTSMLDRMEAARAS